MGRAILRRELADGAELIELGKADTEATAPRHRPYLVREYPLYGSSEALYIFSDTAAVAASF
jgi:hypothetical protein